MGLFRPYERTEPKDKAQKKASAAATTNTKSSKQAPPREETPDTKPAGKSGPTPKRRESEAARWEQLHPKQSKRQQRAESRRKERDQRLKAMEAAEKAVSDTSGAVILGQRLPADCVYGRDLHVGGSAAADSRPGSPLVWLQAGIVCQAREA